KKGSGWVSPLIHFKKESILGGEEGLWMTAEGMPENILVAQLGCCPSWASIYSTTDSAPARHCLTSFPNNCLPPRKIAEYRISGSRNNMLNAITCCLLDESREMTSSLSFLYCFLEVKSGR